jgi:hypothetical protein
MQCKMRVIAWNRDIPVYGITIPRDMAIFFSGCFMTIELENKKIILSSGCNLTPDKSELKKYKIEEFYENNNIKR